IGWRRRWTPSATASGRTRCSAAACWAGRRWCATASPSATPATRKSDAPLRSAAREEPAVPPADLPPFASAPSPQRLDHGLIRAAFADFEPAEVAKFGDADVARLMEDAGIVRNRAKIEATINNARRCLELEAQAGSFARYVWGFETAGPAALSKDLKKRGWAFVGPTTVESFMEAMG